MRSLYPWPIFPPDLDQPAARSLSLQLALQEWIISFEIISSILIKSPQDLDSLSEELQKFLLFSIDNPFAKKAGTLDKLCFYSEELASRSRNNFQGNLDTILDQMRDVILDFRSSMSTWKRKMPPFFMITAEIKNLCSTLTLRLAEFYEALFPFLEEARSDENVLFFLIEKKDIFNRILYPKRIEQLFKRLYPAGPAHLRAIIYEGYTRRGFAEFYAKHEPLIDSIDWVEDLSPLTV